MAPKRANDADADGGLEAPQRSKAPRNRAGESAKRQEQTQKWEDAGKTRDATPGTGIQSDGRWMSILAVHLASEPKFMRFMENPQPLQHICVKREWLAIVYLPGRYNRFKTFESWYTSWWAPRRIHIIENAATMYASVAPPGQCRVDGTLAPLPKNDPPTELRRVDLFRFQMTRQKLRTLGKVVLDTQHDLATDFVVRCNIDAGNQVSPALSEEMQLLAKTRASVNTSLADSPTNLKGVEILDSLLALVPASDTHGCLYRAPDTNISSALDSTPAPDSLTDVKAERLAARIQEDAGIAIDLLEPRGAKPLEKWDDVFIVSALKLPSFERIQKANTFGSTPFVDHETLMDIDNRCSEWLVLLAADFDRERFKLNFWDFEKLTERTERCVRARYDDLLWSAPANRLEYARDNIVHIRQLVAEMVSNDMLVDHADQATLDRLQVTLRRMYALLALMYGCVAEGAVFLTIMDDLLENLARIVVGPVTPKLESTAMRRANDLLQNARDPNVATSSTVDRVRMEREHRARTVFAEISRFYHGAVVLLFAAAAYRKSKNRSETETEMWHHALYQAFSSCDHPACVDGIDVASHSEENKIASTAMQDTLHGFPATRSVVSSNRKRAYPCLSELIMYTRFHVGMVPFYHYFAHLWHKDCRPFRGKSTLVEDITVSEQQQEQVCLPELHIQ